MVSSPLSGPDISAWGALSRAPKATARKPRSRWLSNTLPPLLLLTFSLLGALAVGLAPREGQAQLAVIGAPWTRFDGMVGLVAAADGRIVDAGGLSNVIVAQSDNPDFIAALYRAGAWLVLDPALLRGCLGTLESNR